MENLTMEEMDTYSMISNRIVHEDILSIVDSYFMPYGIQCDQYSILGEIIEYHTVQNNITDEELVQMTLSVIIFDLTSVSIEWICWEIRQLAEGLKVRSGFRVSCIFRIEENIRAEEYRL